MNDDTQRDDLDTFFNEPGQRQTEVIVAHRIGYYGGDIESIGTAEIEEADAYLEAHIQWRIDQAMRDRDE